jgi:hypothetical protein
VLARAGRLRFYREERFLAVDFLREDFLPEDFLPGDLRPVDFFRVDFRRLRLGGGGTLAPFSRASDSPIAMACSRLFTFPPRPPGPLRKVPRFLLRMALSTRLLAALP